jgi:hypothetical protein
MKEYIKAQSLVDAISEKVEKYIDDYKRGQKALRFIWDFQEEILLSARDRGGIYNKTIANLVEEEYKEHHQEKEKTYELGIQLGIEILAEEWFKLFNEKGVEHDE